MSNPFKNYKNVVFPGQSNKTLDKTEEVVYTRETENPVKEFKPDYKAYSIVRAGNKKYQLVSIEYDSKTGSVASTAVVKEFDSEARTLKELQDCLAARAKIFRKESY